MCLQCSKLFFRPLIHSKEDEMHLTWRTIFSFDLWRMENVWQDNETGKDTVG